MENGKTIFKKKTKIENGKTLKRKKTRKKEKQGELIKKYIEATTKVQGKLLCEMNKQKDSSAPFRINEMDRETDRVGYRYIGRL